MLLGWKKGEKNRKNKGKKEEKVEEAISYNQTFPMVMRPRDAGQRKIYSWAALPPPRTPSQLSTMHLTPKRLS